MGFDLFSLITVEMQTGLDEHMNKSSHNHTEHVRMWREGTHTTALTHNCTNSVSFGLVKVCRNPHLSPPPRSLRGPRLSGVCLICPFLHPVIPSSHPPLLLDYLTSPPVFLFPLCYYCLSFHFPLSIPFRRPQLSPSSFSIFPLSALSPSTRLPSPPPPSCSERASKRPGARQHIRRAAQ